MDEDLALRCSLDYGWGCELTVFRGLLQVGSFEEEVLGLDLWRWRAAAH